MIQTPEANIVTKQVKHTFTAEEIAKLNVEFRQAFATLKSVEAEFDNVKAVWKAKTTKAESDMEILNATLQAGFDLREMRCRVEYFPKERKKKFYIEDDDKNVPVAIEDMQPGDYDIELIQAEAKFEAREEIALFPQTPSDKGILVVGRLKGRWYAALRVNVGKVQIAERLDSEQKSVKERPAAVANAAKRALVWLATSLGDEASKGFEEPIRVVIEAHKERAE